MSMWFGSRVAWEGATRRSAMVAYCAPARVGRQD